MQCRIRAIPRCTVQSCPDTYKSQILPAKVTLPRQHEPREAKNPLQIPKSTVVDDGFDGFDGFDGLQPVAVCSTNEVKSTAVPLQNYAPDITYPKAMDFRAISAQPPAHVPVPAPAPSSCPFQDYPRSMKVGEGKTVDRENGMEDAWPVHHPHVYAGRSTYVEICFRDKLSASATGCRYATISKVYLRDFATSFSIYNVRKRNLAGHKANGANGRRPSTAGVSSPVRSKVLEDKISCLFPLEISSVPSKTKKRLVSSLSELMYHWLVGTFKTISSETYSPNHHTGKIAVFLVFLRLRAQAISDARWRERPDIGKLIGLSIPLNAGEAGRGSVHKDEMSGYYDGRIRLV
jgi:hypothetical protein